MCMSCMYMCTCLLTWMPTHMCVEILLIFPCLYMCSIMYRIPWMVLRTTSLIILPHTLRQGLSLNSELIFKLWLASHLALMSTCLFLLSTGVIHRMPDPLSFCSKFLGFKLWSSYLWSKHGPHWVISSTFWFFCVAGDGTLVLRHVRQVPS